jgi:hypothetical protein
MYDLSKPEFKPLTDAMKVAKGIKVGDKIALTADMEAYDRFDHEVSFEPGSVATVTAIQNRYVVKVAVGRRTFYLWANVAEGVA